MEKGSIALIACNRDRHFACCPRAAQVTNERSVKARKKGSGINCTVGDGVEAGGSGISHV